MVKWFSKKALILIVSVLSMGGVSANGFVEANYYPYLSDVDSDSFFTVNSAYNFGNGLSYFGFVNLYDEEGDEQADVYYSEFNLRYKLDDDSPFDLTMQLNYRTGSENDRQRLGVRWRLSDTSVMQEFFKSINMSYAINLHAVQFDHRDERVWQLEHAFMLKFPDLSEKLYLAGFIDHTFNEDLPPSFPSNPIVAEAQLGYQFVENWYLVMEYRVNQYRRSDVNNLAAGVAYRWSF
jgi:hypothetical protein